MTTPLRSLSILAAGAGLLLASPALALDNAPYVGVWDCGVGTFVFTNETYNPGEGMLVATKVEKDRGNYIMSFADGYQIGLSSVGDTSMQWLSFESGDMFDCTRLYR